ncbi:hypothetical protein EON79_09000 [bacterium]|nr:MAG: hypothetical protein EON79_09000 [bacterium]
MRFGGVGDRREIAAQIVRAEGLGLPKTNEEIWPAPVPDAQNAALVYRRLVPRRTLLGLLNALDATGRPKALPLMGEESLDPFFGKPLRYHATAKGIRVWSVGRDGYDENGMAADPGSGRPGDIVAAWPAAKGSKP